MQYSTTVACSSSDWGNQWCEAVIQGRMKHPLLSGQNEIPSSFRMSNATTPSPTPLGPFFSWRLGYATDQPSHSSSPLLHFVPYFCIYYAALLSQHEGLGNPTLHCPPSQKLWYMFLDLQNWEPTYWDTTWRMGHGVVGVTHTPFPPQSTLWRVRTVQVSIASSAAWRWDTTVATSWMVYVLRTTGQLSC